MASFTSKFENEPPFAQDQHRVTSPLQSGKEAEQQPLAGANKRCLLIFDDRALGRECLARTLVDHGLRMDVAAFSSIDECREKKGSYPGVGAVLLNIGARKVADVAADISKLASQFSPAPVVILSDSDDMAQILQVLEAGAQGYIPASVGVDVCIEAIALAMAGGVFVPASSLLAARHLIEPEKRETSPLAGMFTLRQAEVVEALRRGKANKIIGYELNLRESTVKVHVRNIMKKLKATNRTEVACKLNELFSGDGR